MRYLALCLFLCLLMAPIARGLDLSVESKTIRQGEEFTLQASLQNATTLGHVLFDVVYPSDKLQLINVTLDDLTRLSDPQNSSYKAMSATFPNVFPTSESDRLRFGWLYGKGFDGASKVLTLHFKMGSAEVHEIPVRFESVAAVKAAASLDDQPVTLHEATLTVKWLGDVNGDGKIDALDAAKLLRHVVKIELIPQAAQVLADVSGAKGITAYDAALLLQKVAEIVDVFPPLLKGFSAPTVVSPPRHLDFGEERFQERTLRVPLVLDRLEGVLSGEMELAYDPAVLQFVQVRPHDHLKGRLLESNASDGVISLSFAGTRPMHGEGGQLAELEFRLLDESAGQSALQVRRSLFNEEKVAQLARHTIGFIPNETRLLPNYPNPFNPETWIPYQLASDGEVVIRIYDTSGHLVRELDLGPRRKGYYTSRERAAHWDGRNGVGERVASGLYVYEMKAGEKSFLRRLVVLK